MLIVLCRRHVWNAASKRLEESGFSMIPWALVGFLMKEGPATQREIATSIGQHPAGVSRLVDEMEKQGLVRRRRDESDRRRARVEPTRSGEAMVKAAHPLVVSALAEALRGLSPAEQRELARLLKKLLAVEAPACVERVTERATRATERAARTTERAARAKRSSARPRAEADRPRAAPARAKPARSR